MRIIVMAVLFTVMTAATAFPADVSGGGELATGMTLVRAGEYRKAVEVLREAVKAAPDDPQANFYLGVALNRLSEKEAETVLKRSLFLTPDDPYVNFELGLFYFNKDVNAEASDYFENVLSLNPNGEYAAQAREYLKRIAEKGKEKPWEINFLAGMQYDSNVVAFGDGPLPAAYPQKSDWNGLINLRGNYSLIKDQTIELTAGYSLYQTLHTRLSDLDVTQNLLDLSFLYGLLPNVKLRGAYAYEYLFLGGNGYDQAHMVSPAAIVNFEEWGSTTLEYKYRHTSYRNFGAFTNNTDRNGDNHYVGVTHTVPVGKSYSLWGAYSHDEDLTQAGFWDYHGDRGAVGVRALLPHNVVADLSGEYYRKRYEGEDPAIPGIVRDDSQYTVTVTLMKMLTPTFSLIAMEQYSRNQSNVAFYDYVRTVTSLFVNARF